MADRRLLLPTKSVSKGKITIATAPQSRRMSAIDIRATIPSPRDMGTNIRVAVRIRPKNEIEEVTVTQQLEQGKPELIHIVGHNMLMFGDSKELAAFDFVFGPEATQEEVFDSIGLPMVEDVLQGYNSTIFTYGQTGSGKTFSMMGVDIYDEAQRGIIPRAASELFSRIETMDTDGEFTFKCSMVEIYKERLNDLLNPEIVPLRIKEDPHRGIYVEGLKQICVANEEELIETIYLGEQMRTVASTQWNAVSSRSHQIFLLEVRQTLSNDSEKRGILNLVDLAGSEKVTYYGVTGNKLQETKKINLSLSALGNVIHALTSNSEHIPYRDSKLTRLLQESLGGNFKTAVLVAVSPCNRMIDETINSIKFAQRAKRITNQARVNIKESAEMYLKTIAKLKAELAAALNENTWLKSQLGGNVSVPTQSRGVSVLPAVEPPLLSDSSFDQIRIDTMPTPAVNLTQHVNSVFGFDLECEDSYSQAPLTVRPKSTDIDSFPTIPQRRRVSIDMGVGTDVRDEEHRCQCHVCKDRILTNTVKITRLETDVENYRARIRELEAKLQAALVKLTKSESSVHELKETNARLKLKSQDLEGRVEIAKGKVSTANELVKEMKKNLMNLEEKCKEISDLKGGQKDPTVQEFSEYKEVPSDSVDEPEIEQDEDLLSIAYLSTKTPVDFLCMSSYTQSLQQVLCTNSSISSEMRSFSLHSGLLAAAMINCGLAAVLHTLAWKLEVWKRKYALAKHRIEYQKGTVETLEGVVDTLHESFVRLAKRVDKLDAEGTRSRATVSISKEGKGTVTRYVRKSKKKAPDSAGKDGEKSLNFERGTNCMSYLEGESGEFSLVRIRDMPKACETTIGLQKTYTEQLKHTLEETKAELGQFEKLTQAMEKSLLEKSRNERDSWSKCVFHLKSVYESELIRKHEEVIKLHEMLGTWVQRYLDSQPTAASPILLSDFQGYHTPTKTHRQSASLTEAIEQVDKMSKLASSSLVIEARSGDSSPLGDDETG